MSGVGDVPLPARSVPLPAVIELSFQLSVAVTLLSGPATSSELHLFVEATQILGFYYPACGLCIVAAERRARCRAQQGTKPPESVGCLFTGYIEL